MGKVLIVDDDELNRSFVGDVLEGECEIYCAESGEECLSILQEVQPDVILLDWMMPGLNGLEVLGEIRAQKQYRYVRIVMLTAENKSERKCQAWNAEVNGYLTKPLAVCELVAVVKNKLLEKQMFDEMGTELRKIEERYKKAQKMETIGLLAGGIAHDFNNIMCPILAGAEILSGYDLSLEIRDWVAEIKMAGFLAKDLVKQILSFSRQSAQKEQIANVALIVEESLKLLKTSFPENIEISLEVLSSRNLVMATPMQIRQIIMNLCTNAKHAMEAGGGDLVVKLESPDRRFLQLTVQDSGCGIHKELLTKISEPFFTTKAVDKGMGMGLSIVYGIVQNLDAEIQVQSKLGEGTIFRINFPLWEGEVRSEELKKDDSGQILLTDCAKPLGQQRESSFRENNSYDYLTFLRQ